MTFTDLLATPSKWRQIRHQREADSALAAQQAAIDAETAYRNSIWEAQDHLKAFVKERWGAHWALVTIECAIPLDELYELGRLPDREGTRACRKLVRVPVINEEIGIALWKHLAQELKQREEQQRQVAQLAETPKNSSEKAESRRGSSNSNDSAQAKENEPSRRSLHIKLRRQSDHSSKSSQKAALQQQNSNTKRCVFCRTPGALCCKVPPGLQANLSAMSNGQRSDVASKNANEKLHKIFPWHRNGTKTRGENLPVSSETEAPFWHKEEMKLSLRLSETGRDKNKSRNMSKRSFLAKKILDTSNAVAFQKSLQAFGESLSHGYGHRYRLTSGKAALKLDPDF
ncbi:hypothetical protein GQ53DRAFT_871594 [Thozetella sp. PMI_491]|nr:hypothetical protein GQ53DRAFT_871594 [Thozetella sp. PMI_491]